jgi:hypothetical protein
MRSGIYWPAVQQLIVREILHHGDGLSCVDRDILRIDLKISVILGNVRFFQNGRNNSTGLLSWF